MTSKKCTKKRDARAELLFCQSKAIAVLPFSLTLPSSLLNKDNVNGLGRERISDLEYVNEIYNPPPPLLCKLTNRIAEMKIRFPTQGSAC